MVIISRNILSSKSKEEVLRILKDSSSVYFKRHFEDEQFSFYFPLSGPRKMKSYSLVKGYISQKNEGTEVHLEICANTLFYIILFPLLLIGIASLLQGLFSGSSKAIVGVFDFAFCGLVYITALLSGIETLDHLEHKLTRNIQ